MTRRPATWLVIRVHLHEPRFHGRPEWPPSPARLFQALVAGAAPQLADPDVVSALRWLEALDPPTIAAPRSIQGKSTTFFVPNNDLDAKDGDPERVAEVRTAKEVAPRLLQENVPFLYLWAFESGAREAERVRQLAETVYQFGRGVDMAYATGELADREQVAELCGTYPGTLHRPTPGAPSTSVPGGPGIRLLCSRTGTFDSLMRRHRAQGERFRTERNGKKLAVVFAQPPKARFREVVYDGTAVRFTFELRGRGERLGDRLVAVSAEKSHSLVVDIRDAAIARLKDAFGDLPAIDGVLLGRRPGEPTVVAQKHRARIVPLPSIGHEHADRGIRRILVEVPAGGPLQPDDVRWALSGLALDDVSLLAATALEMSARYCSSSATWQSVTPLAIPAVRRRIDPARVQMAGKPAAERDAEEAAAAEAIRQALRHAGIRERAIRMDVRREPFDRHGARAEASAAPPRFPKERLWHARIEFDREVRGPMVLGDGRYLGLGVMQPVPDSSLSLYYPKKAK